MTVQSSSLGGRLPRVIFLHISPCVTPWIPSAPSTRSPIYIEPSSQCTVMCDGALSIRTTRFPSFTLGVACFKRADSKARRSITRNPYPDLTSQLTFHNEIRCGTSNLDGSRVISTELRNRPDSNHVRCTRIGAVSLEISWKRPNWSRIRAPLGKMVSAAPALVKRSVLASRIVHCMCWWARALARTSPDIEPPIMTTAVFDGIVTAMHGERSMGIGLFNLH